MWDNSRYNSLAPLWTERCAKNTYQVTETSDGARQSTESENYNLFGRHPNNEPIQVGLIAPSEKLGEPLRGTRFYLQLGEVSFDTDTGYAPGTT